ncbi:MAG: helix-turn-helix transcriptional regulator [Acidobacteria bacterium]|nr:helix-turn-helix transcriptional regulator [Acidobacteriota bacterium]
MVTIDSRANETSGTQPSVRAIVEDVVGCKWTLHVLEQVRAGVHRPGALVRTTEGLTRKVLYERLAKLVRYGVLVREAYPEVPPRVEYHLTPFGERLNTVLDAIDALQRDVDG